MATTHHATALNLGKLTTPRTDGQAQPRGNGAELRTDAAIALRAAQGMLLTTYARLGAQGSQLDRDELLKLLGECGELFQSLGQTAAARGSQQVDTHGIEALRQSLNQWPDPGSNSSGAPVVAVAAEAGIASATPRSQVHYAGENHDTTAQDYLQLTSGAAMHLNAGQGIYAFTQDHGISAIANRGKVLVQAHEDDIALNAQKNLHLSAAEGEVVITAPTIRLVADDGSFIKIGGGVEIGTQDKVRVHASDHDWVGPKTDSVAIPTFGRDTAAQHLAIHYPGHDEGSARLAVEHAYQIKLEDGSTVQGVTDSSGLTERLERERMHQALVAAVRSIGSNGGSQ
jgi:type VI secretion system secreted protein VgrG